MIGLEDKVSSSLFHSIARPFAVWSRYIGSVLHSPIQCTTLLPTAHPRLFKTRHALPLYSPSAHYFPSYSRRTFRLSASQTNSLQTLPEVQTSSSFIKAKALPLIFYCCHAPILPTSLAERLPPCLDTSHHRYMYTFPYPRSATNTSSCTPSSLCLCNSPYPRSLHCRLPSWTPTFLLCLQKRWI